MVNLQMMGDNDLKKIKVLFPLIESGFGHIMTAKAIGQVFAEKYGDKCDVELCAFFTETGDKHLIKYERMMSRQVKTYNTFPPIGFMATVFCEIFGSVLSSLGSIRLIAPFAFKHGVAHMRELEPDVVFSTHWATNYYDEHIKEDKPFTVMYCPDAQLNKLFEYHADMNMISMPYGYLKALRKRKYDINNMKLVPFFIRNEAFDVCTDKKELRRRLGLPQDKFTVLLAEGGYGIGKTEKLCRRLVKEHVPMTVIPVCGTNKKLYERLKKLECTPEITFVPHGFAENMLELQAAADIFCGKSGNMLAEPTFYGNPSIVNHYANLIERNIADHYLNTVGCTIKRFSPKKTVELLKSFAADPGLMEPYRRAARDYHGNFGAGKAADMLWAAIKERFPDRAV